MMPSFKFLVSDKFDQGGLEILSKGGEVEYLPSITADELIACIQNYDALLVRGRTKVTADVMAATSNLKVVGRAGVGVDNIDLAAAQKQGITVVNTPTATTNAVAEHTLALMLSLVRWVPKADMTMKSGQWAKKQLQGSELYGKTLGIIGLGNIGSAVADRAAAFGMRVVGFDPVFSDEDMRQRGAEPLPLADLYAQADMITLHIPLMPKTRNLIDGQAIAQMKRGVRLVCAARGGVIDETALLSALESGQVAGAALDVFTEEPPGLSALVSHPHVVATPHIGAQTAEAQARAARDLVEEVLAAVHGEPLRWKIV
jgi:D-3-phosphoglycerate dehydrogenase / 2-oxoglutarate reductase